MSDHMRIDEIEKKLVVALKPHREEDPAVMLISVLLLEANADITDDDGISLFNTNLVLSGLVGSNRCTPTVRLTMESSEVEVTEPLRQSIKKSCYLTARSERSFRLKKLNESPMESKQIFLTVKHGALSNRYAIYIRSNKAHQKKDDYQPPLTLYNLNTPKVESSTFGNNGPVMFSNPLSTVGNEEPVTLPVPAGAMAQTN